ncbi:MAG: hypothetical protein WBA35_00805 [Litorimonas sp.]
MTLEAVYYIGQTIAVVAIIASLIFVGVQVRQSAAAMRASAYQTSQDRMDRIRLAIVENNAVAEIYQLANTDASALSDVQLARLRMLLYVTVTSFESLHLDFVQTGAARRYWDRNRAMMTRVMDAPGPRAYWALFREEFDPVFARDLDVLMAGSHVLTAGRADWDAAFKSLAPKDTP